MLSEQARQELISIARAALRQAVTGSGDMPSPGENPALQEHCGCFVTYKTNGHLRGCLGCFTSDEPLCATVARYAQLSATEDPRFAGNRISADELGVVSMDISVLSPLTPCDDPLSITLGKHGIYIKSGWRSGCFLPQVATETGWSVERFWEECCAHKAGLPRDAWKSTSVERYTFTAEVIEAPALDSPA